MKLARCADAGPRSLLSAARVPRRAVVLTKERLHEIGVSGVVFAGPDDSGSWRTSLAVGPGGGGAEGGGVGVIVIEGCLEQRAQMGLCDAFVDGYDHIEERYDAAIGAYQAGEIRKIVTVINSPGGVRQGLFAGARRVRAKLEAAGVPTEAVADEDCCSAAWVWALVSDKLFAPPDGRVASIGAVTIAESIAGLLAKEGREIRVYRSGEKKMRPSGVEPFTEADDADLQARADAGGAMICEWTAERRGGKASEYLALQGAVFSGQEAMRRGLIDGVKTAHEVIEMALKDAEQADIATAAGLAPTADGPAIKAKIIEINAAAAELPAVKTALAAKDAELVAIKAADERAKLETARTSARSAFAAEVQALQVAARVSPASASSVLAHYDAHGEASARSTLKLVTSDVPQVLTVAGAKPGAVPVPAPGGVTPEIAARAKQLGADPNEYAAHVAGEVTP